ncbi:MAG: glycosyltransferase [candidate division Zixibacteria bacterium]|nr:glycosyltransferase [candidate division Zixibacteria bacterium]
MSQKRIVIIGWAESVHVGRWARGLAGRGYDVKIVSAGGAPVENIDTAVLPRGGGFSYLRHASAAAEQVRRFEPDLVHVHYAGGFGLCGMRAGVRPLVVSVWGSDIVDLPRSWPNRYLLKKLLRRADHITATSRMLKTATLAYMSGEDEKVSVVPFGINVPDSCPPLPEGPPRLCFMKKLRPLTGPDLLLKALAKAREKIDGISLTIAGDGPMTGELKQLTADLGLNDCVNFAGWIPNERIPDLLAEHHIMVMPSLKEAFGVAVLEANACGRPVITSDAGGIAEVVRDNETGIMTPAGDVDRLAQAIVKLAGDRELMSRMGRAGYEFVEQNYSWEKSLDMMTELYERLIHEKAKD